MPNFVKEVNRCFLENEQSDLITFFCCFELSNKFPHVNKYEPILSVGQETIVGKIMVPLKGFIWYKQRAVAPKRTWAPLIFISKFKFL